MTPLLVQFGVTKLLLSAILAMLAWSVTRRTQSPHLAHVLWLLPLVTMLTPTLFSVPILPGGSLANEAAIVLPIAVADLPAVTATATEFDLLSALMWLWVIGSLILLLRSTGRMIRFHAVLSRASQPAPAEVQALAQSVATMLGLRHAPAVMTTEATLSPLVWWIGGRTRVVVPSALIGSLNEEQLRWIIAHEFAHVARGDHLMRWIEWCACILFWWNPIVWFARRALHAAEELCCDAMVIATLKPAPRSYAQTLMHVIDWMSHSPNLTTPAIVLTAVSSSRITHLHERLTMIVSPASLTLPSRMASNALRLSAAIMLPLGLLGVSAAPAQVARKSASTEVLTCENIVARIKDAIATGAVTAQQGSALKEACTEEPRRRAEVAVAIAEQRTADRERGVKAAGRDIEIKEEALARKQMTEEVMMEKSATRDVAAKEMAVARKQALAEKAYDYEKSADRDLAAKEKAIARKQTVREKAYDYEKTADTGVRDEAVARIKAREVSTDTYNRKIRGIQADAEIDRMYADDVKARVGTPPKRVNEKSAAPVEKLTEKAKDSRCSQLEQKVRDAVDAGKLTASEGRSLIELGCR